MDKAKKILSFVSLCVVAVCGALVATKELSPSAEHWIALVGAAFGGLAHFLPQLQSAAVPEPRPAPVLSIVEKKEGDQ